VEGDRVPCRSGRISLANLMGKDLHITIPHYATADYVTKLAQTIRYGSDGWVPYTSEQANPVFPPLNPNLKVYVEWGAASSFRDRRGSTTSATMLSARRWTFALEASGTWNQSLPPGPLVRSPAFPEVRV